MGPYCNFCDFRCFVERRLPFSTGTILMATCIAGMAHDRAQTGHDHTTAINPAALRRQPSVGHASALAERDQARGIAVALEQENARLVAAIRTARECVTAEGVRAALDVLDGATEGVSS